MEEQEGAGEEYVANGGQYVSIPVEEEEEDDIERHDRY